MIEILGKVPCVQCTATYRAMDKKGIEYEKTDMMQDIEKFDFARELGHQMAPVVIVRGEDGDVVDHWSGFRPDKIEELAA